MMTFEIMEYVYCLIYVICLSFSVLYTSEERISCKRIIPLVIVYGAINYFITGSSASNVIELIIINTLVVIFDFLFICFIFKNINRKNWYYGLTYELFYTFSVNFIIYFVQFTIGYNRYITLTMTCERTLMTISINILAIIIIIVLKKIKIIPSKSILNMQPNLFILLNIMVYYAMIIIYQIGIYELMYMIMFLVLILLFLWGSFNKVFSLYLEAIIKNEKTIIEEVSNKYIERYIELYKQENENIRKIKHDLKNHQVVLENLDKFNYIDDIFGNIGNDNMVHTGNLYIDTCLFTKQQEYPEIKFDYDIMIDGEIINEKDINSLLFNLIDNACYEALKHDKVVKVSIKYVNEILIIQVTNTCPIKPSFISSRGEGHGYGLKIIKNIVAKYDGDMMINYEDEMLSFRIKMYV